MLKTLDFRPLRRVKKSGKIVVASYSQWRRVKTADYNEFGLNVSQEYKQLPDSEFVYNHKGELLYFPEINPAEIEIVDFSLITPYTHDENDFIEFPFPPYAVNWGDYTSYNTYFLDCDGVPTFTHFDANYIASHHSEHLHDFEPLTVGTVKKWWGWFLWNLQNASVQKK